MDVRVAAVLRDRLGPIGLPPAWSLPREDVKTGTEHEVDGLSERLAPLFLQALQLTRDVVVQGEGPAHDIKAWTRDVLMPKPLERVLRGLRDASWCPLRELRRSRRRRGPLPSARRPRRRRAPGRDVRLASGDRRA